MPNGRSLSLGTMRRYPSNCRSRSSADYEALADIELDRAIDPTW